MQNNTIQAFFALVRAGLWEKEAQLMPYGEVDYEEVMRLAEEQSMVGLVTAGLEHVQDVKVPQEILLQFIGQSLQLEQQNDAMNNFIALLIGKMRQKDIYALLVKGQGIAQCYDRPMWRACGDVDLLLSEENYEKAKELLLPMASSSEKEDTYKKHLAMTIDGWVVELHGYLRGGLSYRINRVLDELRNDVFFGGNVRSWVNGKTHIFLPGINNDVLYVFAHFLNHFYKGGIGLRQICDWCRLLWTYRGKVDVRLLESRIRRAGLMSEWKAFAAFSVDYLGMPVNAIPLYDKSRKWKNKARRIYSFIMMSGNFGHNRDMSYYGNKTYLVRKCISICRRTRDVLNHVLIFPLDSIRFFPYMIYRGIASAVRGE